MTRNLKVLAAAALALMAFGAISATGAQAEDIFHCSVSPCTLTARGDGTGATAHEVFIIENAAKTESASNTCHVTSGHGVLNGNTANELTISSPVYGSCTVNGSPGVTIDMNGCKYKLTGGNAGTTDAAQTHIECEAGNKIQITIPGGCTFEIGPQTTTGVGYHTLGSPGSREVTLTVKNAQLTVTATAGCAALINPNQTLTCTWTTGNVILTGETTQGVMADLWYGT